MSQEPLADTRAVFHEITDTADGVARLTFFNVTFGDTCHPHWVAVEVADNGPDLVGSLLEYCAVGKLLSSSLLSAFCPLKPRRLDFVKLSSLYRLGQPEEIAEIIAFLISQRGRWVTRQNLAADGGIISR